MCLLVRKPSLLKVANEGVWLDSGSCSEWLKVFSSASSLKSLNVAHCTNGLKVTFKGKKISSCYLVKAVHHLTPDVFTLDLVHQCC